MHPGRIPFAFHHFGVCIKALQWKSACCCFNVFIQASSFVSSSSACLVNLFLWCYGPVRVCALLQLWDTWWCFGCSSDPESWRYKQEMLFMWGDTDWRNTSTASGGRSGPMVGVSFWNKIILLYLFKLWIVTLIWSEPEQTEWNPTLFQRQLCTQFCKYLTKMKHKCRISPQEGQAWTFHNSLAVGKAPFPVLFRHWIKPYVHHTQG